MVTEHVGGPRWPATAFLSLAACPHLADPPGRKHCSLTQSHSCLSPEEQQIGARGSCMPLATCFFLPACPDAIQREPVRITCPLWQPHGLDAEDRRGLSRSQNLVLVGRPGAPSGGCPAAPRQKEGRASAQPPSPGRRERGAQRREAPRVCSLTQLPPCQLGWGWGQRNKSDETLSPSDCQAPEERTQNPV